jgi:hypothetical protein
MEELRFPGRTGGSFSALTVVGENLMGELPCDGNNSSWGHQWFWSALTATALGLLYTGALWFLRPAINAIPHTGGTFVAVDAALRGPFVLFLLSGAIAGWLTTLVNERIWGRFGGGLVVPLLAETVLGRNGDKSH